MKVAKFGGSSLADAAQIRKVADIVLQDRQRRVVVVSAPGKRYSADIKITDLLIALANAVQSGYKGETEMNQVASRYAEIARDLGLEDNYFAKVKADLEDRIEKNINVSRDLQDSLKAAGEDNSARLVADYFNSIGEPARYVNPVEAGMRLFLDRGQSYAAPESYTSLSTLDLSKGRIIFPGFFGGSSDGRIRTFSRGGSDITGSILAAALNAEVYENWTDVDSVFVVSPSIVPHPRPIREITYLEMRELAYAGFSVLHEEAISPAFQRNVPVNVRNTNNPDSPGTLIVRHHQNVDSIVTGIAGSRGFALLHVSKYLMNREVGFAMKVLEILADFDIPIEHMPSGIDSISIVMKSEVFTPEKEALITARLRDELKVDNIQVDRSMGVVMLVGDAMVRTVGVTARAAGALAKAGVNLELIIQGASELSIIFGVREEYVNYAIRELYREFFE